jgi:4-amino-4-deoxy-L-arabinose transferase-like glycosyltransferase
VALVGVVYLLTDRVFTRRVAILVGVLAACHPLLIAMSVMVYTESLFVFLILAGAYYALDCLRNPSIAPAVASGTLFGMAYLTRPEGIAYAMLFAGLLGIHAFWARGGAWSMAKQATAIVVLAGLMAAPYVAHLSSLAGGFRWEGKSWMNNIQSERMAAGLSHAEAKRGLVEGLNGRLTLAVDEGDQLRHLRQPSARVGSLSDSLLTSPGENVLRIGKTIFSTLAIGSPAIMLLALLGIAGTRWWRHRFWEGGALLAILGLQLLILMSLQFTWERFLWPMVPVLVIWTAGGVNCMAGLIVGALPQTFSPRGRDTVVGLINCAMIAAIALIALWGVVRAGAERDRLAKEAGEWIREDFARTNPAGRRPVVMGYASSGTLVHYANANLKHLPYAEEPKALQYVRQNPPDYIVVRDHDAKVYPKLANWLERGPADPCAVLAHSWSSKNTRLKIWRWHCSR